VIADRITEGDLALIRRLEREVPYEVTAMVLAGSIGHGTYMPNHIDDIDILGVYMPTFNELFGIFPGSRHWIVSKEASRLDGTYYSFQRALYLLTKSNPNLMPLLFVEEADFLSLTAPWKRVVEARHLFVTKEFYRSLEGYARSQFRDMSKTMYEGYMGEKRKELVDRFGYDTKHAAHTIRILRMGIELMRTGSLNIDRTGIDADELLAIKTGALAREDLLRLADDHFTEFGASMEFTDLPERIDREAVNSLCISVLSDFTSFLANRGE
jgi:predicted nucleotidyltransferase